MRKQISGLLFATLLLTSVSTVSAMTVFDPANYTLNQLRNILMESQHIVDMLEAAKRLIELKNMVEEFRFFNSELIEKGFSEIRGIVETFRDPKGTLVRLGDEFTGGFFSALSENPLFQGRPGQVTQIETWVNRAGSGTTLSYYLNLVPDPLSPNHQYITYEQSQIARSFDEAKILRDYAKRLAEEGEALAQAASQANLLGSSRLTAASMGKLYEILGVILASQGRLAELESISLEQVSREEKLDELARRRLFEDLGEFVQGQPVSVGEVRL